MIEKEITIPTNKGPKKVLENNIIRIEASSNYCKIFFSNERPLVVAKVLHWFQDHLQEEMFCRIHRTHLINRLYVSEVMESSMLKLSNGDMLQISRRKKGSSNSFLKQSA